MVGSSLVQFALVWWLTLETHSGTVLALGTLMGVLPQILITPWAGAYVDRWDRRRTMIVADSLVASATLLLMVAYASGNVEVWMVLLVMFARSTFSGFHWPAMQAATSMMVPREHLARIGGINQAMYGLANVIAAPAGVVLILLLPMWGVLSVDLITAALAIFPLLLINVPNPERKKGEKASLMNDMREGLSFLRSWKGAMSIIFLFMVGNLLLSPAFTLLPLLVIDHFGGGVAELGAMEVLAGIGMLVGGIALGVWGGFRRKVLTLLFSTIILSLGVAALGLLPADLLFWAYISALLIGGMLAMLNGSMMAMMQATVPFAMQGRVFALISSGVTAMMPAGLLLAGPLADVAGVQLWYLIAGIPMFAISVLYLFIPSVMGMETTVFRNGNATEETGGTDEIGV